MRSINAGSRALGRPAAKAAAVLGALGMSGLAGSLTAAAVLAWSVPDFTVATATYTSTSVPTTGQPGAESGSAIVGDYLSDSMTVTVQYFPYLPPSDYQFALYSGKPTSQSCPVSQDGNQELPSGAVFLSGLFSTSADSTNPYTVSSTQASPGSYQVTSAGSYYWIARYYDQVDNMTIFSNCTSEPVAVSALTPTISTKLSAGSIAVGGSADDSSKLSGATANAEGSVTYSYSTNNTCSAGQVVVGAVTVSGGVVPGSSAVTFNTAGSYYWQAVYSGDANNGGATSPCTSSNNELLVVTPAGGVLGASTSTPGTGADLLLPGLLAALAALVGSLLLAVGIKLRRHTIA